MGDAGAGRRRQRPLAEESAVFPATVQQLDAVHAALGRFWEAVDRAVPAAFGRHDRVARAAFLTAVGEIGANIVHHAYPRGAPGTVRLRLRLYPDRVELRFSDRGRPFADAKPRRDREPLVQDADVFALAEGGRGLALAGLALDELRYHRTPGGQNRWRLVKRLA